MATNMSMNTNHRVLLIKERIVGNFTKTNWAELSLLTDSVEVIDGHSRLLRSLRFDDDDYGACVISVLQELISADPTNLDKIETYLDAKLGAGPSSISGLDLARRVKLAPTVFELTDEEPRNDLVSVMMPFGAEFKSVHEAIKSACGDADLECLRADDIWQETTFLQDIVNLIMQSAIVVCDFSNRNPNVMYETGIAHTLGKEVVPIAQSIEDVPSDLRHHRVLTYHSNREGHGTLRQKLAQRLRTIVAKGLAKT